MTLIRSLVLEACLVLLCTSYSASTNAQDLTPGQIYNTNNIVLPTNQGGPSSWENGVYQNNLTCWSWGMSGYCGPNPIVRPGNNINFSFGSTFIYQQQNIADILPASTPGLMVNGYNFGFMAKNGNGWDDGRVDQLSASVRFWDATGNRSSSNLLYDKTYDLNYKFNWTTFNLSENFDKPLGASTIGQVQYGFTGRDNNYWAGPYGPEVTNINFSLKYSVDPCSVNVMSSPSCPGYLSAISSYSTPSATSSEPVTVTSTQSTTTSSPVTSTTPTIVSDTASQPVQTQTTTSSSNSTSTPTAVVSTNTVSVTPSATNPQPKVGEVTVAGSQPTTAKTSVSTSQILSILNSEQSRISKLEMSTASAAVEQAKQESAKITSDAVSFAANQQASNLSSSLNMMSALSPSVSSGPSSAQTPSSGLVLKAPTAAVGTSTQQTNTSLVNNQQSYVTSMDIFSSMKRFEIDYAKPSYEMTGSSNTVALNKKTDMFKYELQSNEPADSSKTLFSSSSPLNAYVNPNVDLTPHTIATPENTVNKNVQPNEAAGGRDITSIAVAPAGYNSYLNFVLKDNAFYKVEEIYKGQVNVDNARALRQLSSDRLHQEMVNQQYAPR